VDSACKFARIKASPVNKNMGNELTTCCTTAKTANLWADKGAEVDGAFVVSSLVMHEGFRLDGEQAGCFSTAKPATLWADEGADAVGAFVSSYVMDEDFRLDGEQAGPSGSIALAIQTLPGLDMRRNMSQTSNMCDSEGSTTAPPSQDGEQAGPSESIALNQPAEQTVDDASVGQVEAHGSTEQAAQKEARLASSGLAEAMVKNFSMQLEANGEESLDSSVLLEAFFGEPPAEIEMAPQNIEDATKPSQELDAKLMKRRQRPSQRLGPSMAHRVRARGQESQTLRPSQDALEQQVLGRKW